MTAKSYRVFAAIVLAVALAGAAGAQTAIELKKELLPKLKRAEAAGKDVGEAAKHYKAGDQALREGLQEEAVEHFTRAKETWPADAE